MKKQSKMIIFKLHNSKEENEEKMLNREIPINIVWVRENIFICWIENEHFLPQRSNMFAFQPDRSLEKKIKGMKWNLILLFGKSCLGNVLKELDNFRSEERKREENSTES